MKYGRENYMIIFLNFIKGEDDMPYIKSEDREELSEILSALATQLRDGDFRGKLNYSVSYLIESLIQANGLSYRLINDIIGVLECSKLEMYRRVAIPYEDTKINENGDVYDSRHE